MFRHKFWYLIGPWKFISPLELSIYTPFKINEFTQKHLTTVKKDPIDEELKLIHQEAIRKSLGELIALEKRLRELEITGFVYLFSKYSSQFKEIFQQTYYEDITQLISDAFALEAKIKEQIKSVQQKLETGPVKKLIKKLRYHQTIVNERKKELKKVRKGNEGKVKEIITDTENTIRQIEQKLKHKQPSSQISTPAITEVKNTVKKIGEEETRFKQDFKASLNPKHIDLKGVPQNPTTSVGTDYLNNISKQTEENNASKPGPNEDKPALSRYSPEEKQLTKTENINNLDQRLEHDAMQNPNISLPKAKSSTSSKKSIINSSPNIKNNNPVSTENSPFDESQNTTSPISYNISFSWKEPQPKKKKIIPSENLLDRYAYSRPPQVRIEVKPYEPKRIKREDIISNDLFLIFKIPENLDPYKNTHSVLLVATEGGKYSLIYWDKQGQQEIELDESTSKKINKRLKQIYLNTINNGTNALRITERSLRETVFSRIKPIKTQKSEWRRFEGVTNTQEFNYEKNTNIPHPAQNELEEITNTKSFKGSPTSENNPHTHKSHPSFLEQAQAIPTIENNIQTIESNTNNFNSNPHTEEKSNSNDSATSSELYSNQAENQTDQNIAKVDNENTPTSQEETEQNLTPANPLDSQNKTEHPASGPAAKEDKEDSEKRKNLLKKLKKRKSFTTPKDLFKTIAEKFKNDPLAQKQQTKFEKDAQTSVATGGYAYKLISPTTAENLFKSPPKQRSYSFYHDKNSNEIYVFIVHDDNGPYETLCVTDIVAKANQQALLEGILLPKAGEDATTFDPIEKAAALLQLIIPQCQQASIKKPPLKNTQPSKNSLAERPIMLLPPNTKPDPNTKIPGYYLYRDGNEKTSKIFILVVHKNFYDEKDNHIVCHETLCLSNLVKANGTEEDTNFLKNIQWPTNKTTRPTNLPISIKKIIDTKCNHPERPTEAVFLNVADEITSLQPKKKEESSTPSHSKETQPAEVDEKLESEENNTQVMLKKINSNRIKRLLVLLKDLESKINLGKYQPQHSKLQQEFNTLTEDDSTENAAKLVDLRKKIKHQLEKANEILHQQTVKASLGQLKLLEDKLQIEWGATNYTSLYEKLAKELQYLTTSSYDYSHAQLLEKFIQLQAQIKQNIAKLQEALQIKIQTEKQKKLESNISNHEQIKNASVKLDTLNTKWENLTKEVETQETELKKIENNTKDEFVRFNDKLKRLNNNLPEEERLKFNDSDILSQQSLDDKATDLASAITATMRNLTLQKEEDFFDIETTKNETYTKTSGRFKSLLPTWVTRWLQEPLTSTGINNSKMYKFWCFWQPKELQEKLNDLVGHMETLEKVGNDSFNLRTASFKKKTITIEGEADPEFGKARETYANKGKDLDESIDTLATIHEQLEKAKKEFDTTIDELEQSKTEPRRVIDESNTKPKKLIEAKKPYEENKRNYQSKLDSSNATEKSLSQSQSQATPNNPVYPVHPGNCRYSAFSPQVQPTEPDVSQQNTISTFSPTPFPTRVEA